MQQDPVRELFSVLLTGTAVLQEKELSSLSDNFGRLYANKDYETESSSYDNLTAPLIFGHVQSNADKEGHKNEAKAHKNSVIAGHPALTEGNIFKKLNDSVSHTSNWKACMSPPPVTKGHFSSPSSAINNVDISMLLCNGRCGGRVDTPLCTEICCQVVIIWLIYLALDCLIYMYH